MLIGVDSFAALPLFGLILTYKTTKVNGVRLKISIFYNILVNNYKGECAMPIGENTPKISVPRLGAQRLMRYRGTGAVGARLSIGDRGFCAVGAGATRENEAESGEAAREQASPRAGRESLRSRATPLICSTLAFPVYGAVDEVAKRAVLCVFSVMPEAVRREIEREAHSLGRELDALEEIRLSLDTKSSIVMMGEERELSLSLTKEDFFFAVRGICHGTPFSYRAELAQGYLPFGSGVRVGAVGEAHYNEQRALVGVSDIHTLIFRIPHAIPHTGLIDRICTFLSRRMRRGCLILGAPRAGKTTLLRALSRALCTGEEARRVAVVDTRREFSPEDGAMGRMDILTGYRRMDGATIALRTLSPEVIVMDEVGAAEDAEAIRCVLASGVALLATAHAHGIEDAMRRRHLRVLLEDGAFDYMLLVCRAKEGARLSLYGV